MSERVNAITREHRFARPRVYGWALFVTVNGRPRKVGEARTDGQYRSFMRGGTW